MSDLTVAEAREQFAEILNRAFYGKERIIVTRRNRQMAALVPIEDLQTLEALENEIDVKEAQIVLAKPMKAIAWNEAKKSLKHRTTKKKK